MTVRVRIEGAEPGFAPRAAWVLETLVQGLGATAEIVDGPAEVVYAPSRPAEGVWIPAERDAQRFFAGPGAFPGRTVHRVRGLTLLFPPSAPEEHIPGDIVASAFYLLARWDEHRVAERDRFGRLPLASSAFAAIEGLHLEDPPVEGYLAALRRALGLPEPSSWDVFLTHDIDRLRLRTARGLARVARRGGPRAVARLAAGPDPWDNVCDLLETTSRRGLGSTVFLIGRNAHPLDGTPRRVYERHRAALARAVRAAGGEVGLHAAFASSEGGPALAAELASLRAEAGAPVDGVRFHYLRFRYHQTVRWLEDAGAAYDASLGFSEAPGFAAGYARPFRPWIVGEERAARLWLVPLAVMDTTLHSHLGLDAEGARERALAVLDVVRRVGGRACLLWHNTYLADARAPGYGPLWDELLDELAGRGARMGPVTPPAAAIGASLEGRRVLHLTSVHRPNDVRILHKEVTALRTAGADARVLALREPARRARRIALGWQLVRAARRRDADLYHLHDPELLPAGLWLRRVTGRPVVYDVHEYLGHTTRAKGWLPGPVRAPLAWAVERLEHRGARRLSGVVAVNEDLAARFAAAGASATVSVANYPSLATFGEAPPAREPVVLYVGGLARLRGLDLMLEAFPRVTVPGARLLLVGRGDPGPLPDRVEHLGMVDHSEVPALLARAAVAWIPLQRHGNYDRAVPTKLVEAMAASRPVVASDLRRMAALVRSTGCGLVVPPDDPDAHAEALTLLLTDRALAARLGDAGRQAFLAGLTFESQADRLTSLYDRILRP